MQSEQKKCDHEACTCLVPADESHCSAACAADASMREHPASCDCGHTACGSTVSESLLEG